MDEHPRGVEPESDRRVAREDVVAHFPGGVAHAKPAGRAPARVRYGIERDDVADRDRRDAALGCDVREVDSPVAGTHHKVVAYIGPGAAVDQDAVAGRRKRNRVRDRRPGRPDDRERIDARRVRPTTFDDDAVGSLDAQPVHAPVEVRVLDAGAGRREQGRRSAEGARDIESTHDRRRTPLDLEPLDATVDPDVLDEGSGRVGDRDCTSIHGGDRRVAQHRGVARRETDTAGSAREGDAVEVRRGTRRDEHAGGGMARRRHRPHLQARTAICDDRVGSAAHRQPVDLDPGTRLEDETLGRRPGNHRGAHHQGVTLQCLEAARPTRQGQRVEDRLGARLQRNTDP